MDARRMRFHRGWLTAGLSVVVAAFSHVAGGGAEPGLLGVGLALAFALPVCVALAGRRVSTPRLAASVVLSQFAFHVLFSLGSTATTGLGASGGHHSPLILTVRAAAGATAAPEAAMSTSAMWLAHALAAVVTVAAMVRGHRAMRTALRAASRRAVAAGRVLGDGVVPVPEARLLNAVVPPLRRGRLPRFLTASPHRGPPRPV